MLDTEVWIYALVDPRTDAVRYVGQTRNVERRYRTHCGGSGTNAQMWAWLKELASLGLVPTIQILEHTCCADADAKEWYWIEHAVRNGVQLLNKQGMSRFRDYRAAA